MIAGEKFSSHLIMNWTTKRTLKRSLSSKIFTVETTFWCQTFPGFYPLISFPSLMKYDIPITLHPFFLLQLFLITANMRVLRAILSVATSLFPLLSRLIFVDLRNLTRIAAENFRNTYAICEKENASLCKEIHVGIFWYVSHPYKIMFFF